MAVSDAGAAGPEVADSAFVDPTATLGQGCVVSPFAFVGANVRIGARTLIGPGAVILEGCEIGDDCVIAGEAVVGSRGFGYVFDGRQHVTIPQIGRVVIGSRTTIGPATCLDRAALDLTSVGDDCRIGPLVQIAHNCQIGDDCHIGGGSGLAGSTRIGRGARFGDRVGTAGHSRYGENVLADDLAGIAKVRIPSNSHWSGYPARMISKSSDKD
jgi:UDP-3-O-[3-hydroxymyristoyl] glucosamine N-acyltransferase